MLSFLATCHAIAVIVMTTRILYRDDISSSARMGWFVTLVTLPGIGSAIYLLFGEVYISRHLVRRHRAAMARMLAAPGLHDAGDGGLADVPEPYRAVFRYGRSINGFPATRGNRIELLEGADSFADRLEADIDAATERISILYYIWLTDQTGTRIAEALIRAAGRGVACRVMADEVGSRKLLRSALWRDMGAAGVELAVAMPLEHLYAVRVLNRFDLRNHRKITVIDGRIGYCGSRNCADPAFLPKARFGPWVDIMTRLTGPAVNQMEALFLTDWQAAGKQAPLDRFTFDAPDATGGAVAQVRGTGPLKRTASASQSTSAAIHSAQAELIITTPYFVPDQTALNAICKAAWSGVAVTLTVPARNDSWVVGCASRSHYNTLLTAGVRIFEYRPGLLHAKTMTIDGVFSMIGSSNLDLRSFDLNYENDLLIHDTATTAAIRARQLSYLEDADEILPHQVQAWSALRRIWYNVFGTLGPVL